ncbi:MAG: methyl-accepting chemotaxis protein [Pseudomonadota bacterium]
MSAAPDSLRMKSLEAITVGSWAITVSLTVMALVGGVFAWSAAIVSAAISMVPTLYAYFRRTDGAARITMSFVVAIQPTVLLFALQGSVWQMDMHLLLLIALTALVPLCDIRPIIAACAIILVHHALLAIFAPQWEFFGDSSADRILFHAAIFLIAGALMSWCSYSLHNAYRRLAELRCSSDDLAAELKKSEEALKIANSELETERENSARAKIEIMAARKAAYENVAAQFEQSVIAVTASVADTADLLQGSARSLKILADQAGQEAREVAGSAEAASKAANTVAAGVAELSLSIAEVAVHAGQQSELTSVATERSSGGGEAIGALTQYSRTISQATRAIARIAERTNLLSLNATIEAVSAGNAGLGFSTVAQEVKILADQAALAAKEIEDFLSGVRTGTLEAERSFKAIDAAIGELGEAARSIRYDVDTQRQSADTIQDFARSAAGQVDAMAEQTSALAQRAVAASDLSTELDKAAEALAENVRNLEAYTVSFSDNLKTA